MYQTQSKIETPISKSFCYTGKNNGKIAIVLLAFLLLESCIILFYQKNISKIGFSSDLLHRNQSEHLHQICETQVRILMVLSQMSGKNEEEGLSREKRSENVRRKIDLILNDLDRLSNIKRSENEAIKKEMTRMMALNDIIDQLIWALIIVGGAIIQYLLFIDRSSKSKITQNYFLN